MSKNRKGKAAAATKKFRKFAAEQRLLAARRQPPSAALRALSDRLAASGLPGSGQSVLPSTLHPARTIAADDTPEFLD